MNNTELYINGRLVDTRGDLGVRLNRKLIDPGALNTVDAQFSYTIDLPWTQKNVEAFNYASVEETRNKFNRVYRAELIVNSVRVFGPGLFRLTSINAQGIKGQLYTPAKKTIKDIFGDLKLNENAPYNLPFIDFAQYINLYNNAAATTPQAAIFPYVLYGVLPKVPINRDANQYSARTLWDNTVRLGMADLAPAINPLIMLKHIFNSNGYDLQGSAFQDEKLAKLYQSYRNAPDYVQPWNYGYHATVRMHGAWSSRNNKRTGAANDLERGVNQSQDQTGGIYSCDFFDATNTQVIVDEDRGGNVLYKEIDDNSGKTWVNCQLRVPASGFYKVKFNASLSVDQSADWRTTDPATGVQHVGGRTDNARNDFNDNQYGMRLIRDRRAGDFGIEGAKLDGNFYYDNQPQNETFDESNIPKYFPQVTGNGQINFVDAAQDDNILLGFEFGRHENASTQYVNPRDNGNTLAQVLVAKPAVSWNTAESSSNPTRLAISAPGYWKYGRIGNFDNEGDNPNVNIDYSAGARVTGKVLNSNGMPVSASGGNLDARVGHYYISLITGFQVRDAGWNVTEFITLADYVGLMFSGEIEENADVAVTAFYDINMQYIGYGVAADASGTFDHAPVSPPEDAVYVRLSEMVASPLTLEASGVNNDNIILSRFPLQRYYTYVITAPVGSNYTGYAYIHNDAEVTPTLVVEFIDGRAQFDTTVSPLTVFNPRLTIYLKTPDYSVDGTLTISRTIAAGSESVVDWELTNKYAITLNGAPDNFARRGQFNGAPGLPEWFAQGSANAVVWLDAGELLTVASVSSEGRYRRDGMHSTYGWASHEIIFNLSIEPYRVDPEWLKVDLRGNGLMAMQWGDPVNFDVDHINLVGFLDAEMKTDEYIDNFCKAWNLGLSQISATAFSLDVKQAKTATSNVHVDLDEIASVTQRENTPLGLPSQYVLGFTIDTEEEGYVETGETGGGTFNTGATEGGVVTQTSLFSYNWFKAITKVEAGGNITINLPIISKSEAWDPLVSYPDAMKTRYTDLAQRFMYYGGILPGTYQFNGTGLQIANVRNDMPGVSILNYKNALYTILYNYFTLLISGASEYTNIKGYLSAPMYRLLDGSRSVKFNGDLYFIAELSGYDPYNKNQTNIKLIRKL